MVKGLVTPQLERPPRTSRSAGRRDLPTQPVRDRRSGAIPALQAGFTGSEAEGEGFEPDSPRDAIAAKTRVVEPTQSDSQAPQRPDLIVLSYLRAMQREREANTETAAENDEAAKPPHDTP